MKYKKKTTKKNKSAEEVGCVDPASYSTFNQTAALSEARSQASSYFNDPLGIGQPYTIPSNGCNWRVRVEVRNASYALVGGPAPNSPWHSWGLPPLQRCLQKPTKPTGRNIGQCQNGTKTEVNEYTPGGSKPPCPNNLEGTCFNASKETNWSQGSSWQIDNSKSKELKVSLSYDYRLHPTTIYNRWKSGNCNKPNSTAWARKEGQGGTQSGRAKAKVTTESRCYDEIENYDCCCSCKPVKVPVIEYCQRPIQLNQAQVDQLRNGIMAAMVVGLCVLALTRGAALRALILGAAGAAGCSTSEEEIESGCAP